MTAAAGGFQGSSHRVTRYDPISIWGMGYDMGDDSIDTVILHIDMGHLVTLIRAEEGGAAVEA
jgi:hypothetical protein